MAEGDTLSESGSIVLNEDSSSVVSSVTTGDSAYASSGTDTQPTAIRGKKKVCFEADDSLVRVFEIPYDYDDSPLPEELEPCNPINLVQKFEELALQSVMTTKYGSYALPNKQDGINIHTSGLDDVKVSMKDAAKQNETNNVGLEVKNTKRERKHRHSRKTQASLLSDSSQQEVKPESRPENNDTSMDNSKGHIVHCTKKKKNDRVSYPLLSREKPKRDGKTVGTQHVTHKKVDKKLANIHDLLHHRPRTRGYLQKSNSVDSISADERRRPKSCTSLPTLHLSPYRRVTKTDYPVPAKSITFPDFISQGPGSAKTESASWAKMSFISKDCSPPSERRDNGSATASKKLYSWKVANGIIKPVDITSSSITPMWENLTSKPSTAEANSVLSAL